MIEGLINALNTNKYFVGFTMIILTIGGRFIISELSDEQKSKIDTPIFRKIFIFCSFFMATRDMVIASLLTIGFLIFLESINFEDEKEKFEDDIEEVTDNLGVHITY
jgi:hypothetical protein